VIEAGEFIDRAYARGFHWYAGVPCSFLTPFINYTIDDARLHYLSAANEGDACAAMAGVALGGARGVAMMQNSGLGNAVNPLTSLAYIFRIPVLVICTQRGAPGVHDEPQHALMGVITERMFETMRIPHNAFPTDNAAVDAMLDELEAHFARERRPYALIMQRGAVASCPWRENTVPRRAARASPQLQGFRRDPAGRASRQAALQRILARTPEPTSIVITTTGYTGRELYALADRPNQFYMVGSMGCASSLGLGLSLRKPERETVVIDGDGAALMRLGNLATVGSYAGDNYTHIVLDNEAHDSTGAQATVSGNVDFAAIAAACGYASAISGDDVALIDQVCGGRALPGPRLLHLKIRPGTIENLPRPTIAPEDVAARLMEHINGRGPR
jgi:phosphonopyruvate decarboxylase